MKTVIFVCGTARCGSTMTDLILGNDKRGFSLGEAYAFFYPWRSTHFDIKCACGVYPCPTWEGIGAVKEDQIYTRLFEYLDIDFIVDSSKRLTWVIDQNIRLKRDPDIQCYNVFFYKDPLSLYYSYWKRGFKEIKNIPQSYVYYSRAMQANIPMITVNYDWFIENGEDALRVLCGLLDIPYFKGKMAFWNKEHHHLFGSFGPRKQLFNKKEAKIYTESFVEEFENQSIEFKKTLSENRHLSKILESLKRHDILNVNEYPDATQFRTHRPYFYYRDRLEAFKRSLKPERYIDMEASLIRKWRV